MKKFEDGSVLYEPHERLTYLERFEELLQVFKMLYCILLKKY